MRLRVIRRESLTRRPMGLIEMEKRGAVLLTGEREPEPEPAAPELPVAELPNLLERWRSVRPNMPASDPEVTREALGPGGPDRFTWDSLAWLTQPPRSA